jgi:glc operon protein GlcG
MMRSKQCLTAHDARIAMVAAREEATKNKWNVSIALVDESGYLWHLERMDGAGLTTPEVALGKARTAALTKESTRMWEDRIKERPAFLTFPTEVLIWGGVPIFHAGECIGGIGVSGVAARDDEKVAEAAIAALDAQWR